MSMVIELRNQADRGADHLVQQFCSSVLGCSITTESLLSVKQYQRIFCELARQQEAETIYSREERLTWRREHLSAERLESIQKPILDELILSLRSKLPASASTQGAEPVWPDRKPFALCITHDIDHVSRFDASSRLRRVYRYASYPERKMSELAILARRSCRSIAGIVLRKHLLKRDDPLSRIADWMKFEDSLGFRSTFFFVPSTIRPWHPFDCDYSFGDRVSFEGCRVSIGKMMREIAERGWDVGLHGSYYSATVPGVLKQQKEEMERVLGRSVVTTRQHFLQYDPKLTPSLQSDAGLLVDSTQGFNDIVGFRAGTSFPYLNWDWQRMRTLPVLEIPLHIQDGALLQASRTETEAIATCLTLMEAVQSVGGCLVIVWHPWWLADDTGLGIFCTILEEAKLRNAWGCSLHQVAEWWMSRAARILSRPRVELGECECTGIACSSTSSEPGMPVHQ